MQKQLVIAADLEVGDWFQLGQGGTIKQLAKVSPLGSVLQLTDAQGNVWQGAAVKPCYRVLV